LNEKKSFRSQSEVLTVNSDLYTLFVSHYGEEKPIAQAVHDLLEEAYSGFAEVFISSEIAPGTDWLQDIKNGLNAADEIVTIFTYKSAERPWVNIETGYGVMAEKVVTPVLFAGFTKADLPIIYHLRQAVDSRSEANVEALYNSILGRIRKRFPTARPRWNQKKFWDKWRTAISKAESLCPENARRSNECAVVWLLGSHRDLADQHEQQKALQVCQALARAFMAARFQLVMGTSRMLEYLSDKYVDYMENPQDLAEAPGEPWRKTLANEHAQSPKPAPNPIILLGSLQRASIREEFNDAIGRFPDIAVLIGGRLPSDAGRSATEYEMAIAAEIPLLPIQFTGGAAGTVEPTTDPSLKGKVAELQKLKGNMDRIGPLLVEIVDAQAAIQRRKFVPVQP
jgi:hypothetical protein